MHSFVTKHKIHLLVSTEEHTPAVCSPTMNTISKGGKQVLTQKIAVLEKLLIPFQASFYLLPTLGGGGEGDDRGWDGWMASLTLWTWVWAGSRNWWWTGKPGVLQSTGLPKVRRDWATELNYSFVHLIQCYLELNTKFKILQHSTALRDLCTLTHSSCVWWTVL